LHQLNNAMKSSDISVF